MKKTTILLLTLLTLTPLFLPLVQGEILVFKYSTDRPFSIEATEGPLTACTTQPYTDTITIQNLAENPQNFRIETNIENRVSGTQPITLNAEEQRQVPISISTRNTYNDDYTLFITNQDGDTQQIQRNLQINQCQTIQASLYRQTPQQQNPCQPNNYLIELQNPSPYTETYTVEGPQNTIIASPTIEAQSQEVINHTFRYDCSIYGNTTPTYTINAQESNLQTTLQDTLTINQEYSYTIERVNEEPTPPYCTHETGTETYTVTNQAPFTNNYTITTTNGDLNTTTLSIDAEQTKPFTINHQDTTPGENQYEVTITSQKGDVTQTYNHSYTVEQCYDVTATIENTALCTNQANTPVTITNNGRFTQNITTTFNTTIQNTQFANQNVELQPGQSETRNIDFYSDAEGRNQDDITITTTHTQRNNREYQNTQTQPLQVYDERTCAEPNIDEQFTQRYTTQAVPLPITNTGIQEGTYRILIDSDTFTLSDTIAIIQPTETHTVYLDHNISNEDAEQYNPEITLRNIENNQTYTYTPQITLIPTPWPERVAAYIQETPCAQIATLLIFLIITSLLLSRITALPTNITPLILALLLLIPFITYSVLGVPQALWPEQQVDTSQDGIHITTNQEQSKELFLPQYFNDPDQDNIIYTTSNLSIQYTLIDDTLFIQPQNTSIIDYGTITATDTANASTTVDLTVYVRPKQPETLLDIYEVNCDYINVLLFMIFLTTLLFYKQKKDLQKPTERNTKQEIKEWLEYHNIPYTDNMTKQELLKKIR